MKNKWIQQGDNFKLTPSSISVKDSLPNGIYSINQDPMTREFSLNRIADKFEFDFEIINAENKFINHVMKSYENTTGNLGILLNGLKGSGKSVTAKLIANRLNKPVILIDMPYRGISEFLASLEFDCTLFFDEFEKNFDKDENTSILTIMDGVYNCNNRKVFILTTNELKINRCLLSRPSRIRYIKEFESISDEFINVLFDKYLKYQECRESLLKYVKILQTSSIDTIKSLISEVNIHGPESINYIKEIFNAQLIISYYNILTVPSTYFDNARLSEIARTKQECLDLLDKFIKSYHTDRHEGIWNSIKYSKFSDLGCTQINNVQFPCPLEELKPGVPFSRSLIIEEVNLEKRIVVVRSVSDGGRRYYYICPE